jgi:hypothetical protein
MRKTVFQEDPLLKQPWSHQSSSTKANPQPSTPALHPELKSSPWRISGAGIYTAGASLSLPALINGYSLKALFQPSLSLSLLTPTPQLFSQFRIILHRK